jgi:DNA-binding response OmpR family regulator
MKHSSHKALLATSDCVTRAFCEQTLSAAGLSVVVVRDGVAAVIAAREAAPEVILLDFQLRDAPGREAAGWLRANPALLSTPIIMLNTASDDDAPIGVTQPAMALPRPLEVAALQSVVRGALKKTRASAGVPPIQGRVGHSKRSKRLG